MGSRAGYDDKCGGVFTSGGSLSNLTGMIAARGNMLTEDDYPIGTAYLSDQAHSSIKKGLRLIGIRHDNIRIIPSNDQFQMDCAALESAIKEDLLLGKKPFLVVATVGTTNTGSIDPFDTIADLADKYNMWMHVDGAFGGSILFSDIYNHLAKGIERANSLSWDTHKWSMQAYSCSCIIAKDKKHLINVFAEHPEYLADVIDYSFLNGHVAEKELKKYDNWEITSKPMCGTITFRYAPSGFSEEDLDNLNGAISQQIISENYAYIVTTTVKNKRVLRMNMINCNTTTDDVELTIEHLNEIAIALSKK